MAHYSIVIPTLNEHDNMAPLLAKIDRSGLADFEVIVVDEHSPDDTLGAVAAYAAGRPEIIGMFNDSNNAQLVYTTHNTRLLNTDFQRRDQVYFVNKREDGSSDLYSLFDFKDFRDTLNMEKAYLQGRFDAIPYLSKPTI